MSSSVASTSTASVPPGAVTVRDHRPGPVGLLADTWRHRALIPRVGIRVIVKGYSGAKLGRFWLVARPVLNIFAMGLLFGAVLSAPSAGRPYLLFLLVGMIAWMSFERFAFWATRSFDIYRRLAHNLAFPLLIVPTAGGMAAAIEFIVLSCLLVVIVLYYLVADGTTYLNFGPELLVAVAGFVLTLALAWSVGLWTSALNAYARDVRIVFRYVLMVWMYITPVLYAVSALPEALKFVATVNPLAAPVEMVKHGLIDAGSVKAPALAWSLGWLAVLAGSGLWFFARVAPGLLRAQPLVAEDEEEG
jgi:lipopolysaccharide transport system permease protein